MASVENLSFLSGGGEMGALMRARDWSASTLGSPERWPQSLKTALRILLDSRYAMWMGWGPQLSFLYNDAYRPTLGTKHPWALGPPARDVWAEIWPDIGPRIDSVLQRGEATWDEALLLFLERSGFPEETYHTFSYSPLRDDADAIAGMLCVVTEETERVIGERRLGVLRDVASGLAASSTEEELLGVVRHTLEPHSRDLPFTLIYLFDADGQRARLALRTGIGEDHPAAVAEIEGNAPWPVADVLGQLFPVTVDGLAQRFGELPTGPWDKPPAQALILPLAQQGQTRPAGVMVAGLNPHRPLDEAYRGFVGLFAGQIAAGLANARAYAQERKRAEALAKIDRAKTLFFGNVSHEFRTPLTLMLGPLLDILSNPAARPDDREQIALVYRNGLRLLKLVNNLLDFSRIEAGRMQAVYQATDLAQLTADLASVFRSAIEQAGLQLVVECPPLDQPAYVDRDMWEKIVLNLLSNAFKFTLDGEIAVTLRRAGERVQLAVRDTGSGIPAEELPHLFERFYRVQGARGRTQEGSGIGLALVLELVKLHGGTIGVTSEEGQGSTFTLSLPLGRGHLPEDRIVAAATLASSTMASNLFIEEALRWLPGEHAEYPPAGVDSLTGRAAPAGGPRERIVLADDNADMRQYVGGLLGERYAVEAVPDGLAALHAVRRQRPALVISDVMMPKLDGFGLLHDIRADPRLASLPVIFLSARAGEEATVEGIAAGADDYVVKPFGARELLARVGAQIDRKRFEKALHDTEEKLDVALKNAPIVVYTTDRALRYTWVHRAPMDLAPGAVLGRRDDEIFPPDGVEELLALKLGVLQSGRGDRKEIWLHAADRAKVYDTTVEPLRAETGEVIGLTVAAVDVTPARLLVDERERLLESERAARAEAERMNRMKDEFLATLSHELRTPLNAILGWSQVLGQRNRREEDLAQGVEAIQRNARAQTQMIEDLLDMSRIISGKIRLDVQHINLADVIVAAIESVQPAVRAKGLRLIKIVDPLAGPISGDPARLQQVVWNLLSNAVKFTRAAGRIQVMLERVDSHVEISVGDTGQGIAPQFLPYVFDRFRQADASTTRRHGGLGLGLSIVKQLVELHGGTVRAKSPGEGQGATFVVALPVIAAHAEEGKDRRHPTAPRWTATDDGVAPRLDGCTILVVDDDHDARELLGRILSERGAQVTTASSAAQGFELLRSQRPHLLISDIGMPGEDGYDLIRKVRSLRAAEGGQTPAVALTAFARSEDRRRVYMAGYQMHVAKPVEPAELVAICAAVIDALPRNGGESGEEGRG